MKPRTIGALVLISACFCIGLATVVLSERTTASTVPSIVPLLSKGDLPELFSPGRKEDTTILILGVDRLDNPDPRLRAIWVLTLPGDDEPITLSGVPVDLDLVEGAGVTLESFFAWTPDHAVAPPFLEALERALRIQVQIVVVMDEQAFMTLVDYLGGVPYEQGALDGQAVLALHEVFAGDSENTVRLQGSVLQALLPQAAALGANPDLEPLLALTPDHVYLSIRNEQFVLLLSRLLPIDPDRIAIQLVLHPVP